MSNLLIWGQANPEAMADGYSGVYLNKQDMHDMVQQVTEAKQAGRKIPVLIEHTGDGIGHVVSAWVDKKTSTLQCALELNKSTLESAIGQQLIKDGLVKELSLGYLLDIKQTKNGINATKKHLQEISIVKKGARDRCHIKGFTVSNN
jgi:hypothetical protein